MKNEKENSSIDLLKGKVSFRDEPLWYRLVVILMVILFLLIALWILKLWLIPALTFSSLHIPKYFKDTK